MNRINAKARGEDVGGVGEWRRDEDEEGIGYKTKLGGRGIGGGRGQPLGEIWVCSRWDGLTAIPDFLVRAHAKAGTGQRGQEGPRLSRDREGGGGGGGCGEEREEEEEEEEGERRGNTVSDGGR